MTRAATTPSSLTPKPSSPREGRPQDSISPRCNEDGRRRQALRHRLLALAAALCSHTLVFAFIFQLAERPVEIPPTSRIMVALIEAEAETAPPAEEESPEPPAPDPLPEPPPPKPEPPLPKPAPKPQPTPKPKPKPPPKPVVKPAPEPPPVLTESETALSSTAEAEAAADSAAQEAADSRPATPPPAPPPPRSGPRAEVGAQLTAARFDAAYLNNPAPKYPAVSRRLREEGQVMLRVLVNTDGSPQRVELHASSGSERLDKAALAAVSHWRFVPAQRGERKVEAWVQVPIVFKLKGN